MTPISACLATLFASDDGDVCRATRREPGIGGHLAAGRRRPWPDEDQQLVAASMMTTLKIRNLTLFDAGTTS